MIDAAPGPARYDRPRLVLRTMRAQQAAGESPVEQISYHTLDAYLRYRQRPRARPARQTRAGVGTGRPCEPTV